MSRRKLQFIAAAVTASTMLLMGGCASSLPTQVSWQEDGRPEHKHPTQTWWKYQFVYHPNKQVYYEPFSKTYYWFDNDLWHSGPQLPSWISLHDSHPVAVKLNEDLPFAQHETVLAQAGPAFGRYPGSKSIHYGPNAEFRQMIVEARHLMAEQQFQAVKAFIPFEPDPPAVPNLRDEQFRATADPTTANFRHLQHAGAVGISNPRTWYEYNAATQRQLDRSLIPSPMTRVNGGTADQDEFATAENDAPNN